MIDRAFFVRGDDGNEYGPVLLPELREWVRENRAGLGTMVRLEDPDSPWQAWQEFPELVVLLAEGNARSLSGQSEMVLASLLARISAAILDMVLCFILFIPLSLCYFCLLSPEEAKAYSDFQLTMMSHGDTITPDTKIPDVVYNLTLILMGVWVVYLTSFLFAHGKTPAKALFGIQVVNALGQNPTLLQSAIRAVCFVFAIWILNVYGIIFFLIPYFFGGSRRSLHDLVAGTMVIKTPKSN